MEERRWICLARRSFIRNNRMLTVFSSLLQKVCRHAEERRTRAED